ncbi:MAG: heme o synthase [Alphaproteobacteria bacterium]
MAEVTTDIGAESEPGEAAVRDFFALLKPRVMSLVIFTAFVGLMLAPGDIHPVIGFTALLCVAVGAGASGALNMWYDADIDQQMSRTKDRPIPAGKIGKSEALGFGVILSVLSVLTLGVLVNYVAGALLALTIGFYVFIYTMWLKRRTPQNIVIGGAAGAFPPMIGWAAVTGDVSLESFALFAITFMWTPPHFWALALVKAGDYEKVGVPMMPNVRGADSTRLQIVIYTVLMVPVTLVPSILGFAGVVYGVVAAIAGLIFLILSVQVYRQREGDAANKAAMRLFFYSIFYLAALFGTLLIENLFIA